MFNKSDKERIQAVDFLYVHYFKKDLKQINMKDKSISKKLDNMLNAHGFEFYIVKKNGDVAAAPNKDIKKIDASKIVNGKREILNLNSEKKLYRVTGCDYLKDGYYVYFFYLGRANSDIGAVLAAILSFVIIFGLLSIGRINYIIDIRKSIRVIAQGKLKYRVPLKYKNELRELAEDINYMASELEEEDVKRRTFLTNISHDLRTPLTSILGYLTMINEKKYENKEELNGYIYKINSESLFLKSMLDDFFQYSKLFSKDIKLNKETIYIQELIRQIVEVETVVFKNKNLKLCLTLSNDPIAIKGDGNLLARAVNNLLSNALKYSQKNTEVNIEVYEKLVDENIMAVIAVSNVPEEKIEADEIENFFERLYKKDKSRSKPGSGLGLSIVKEILEIHDGYIKGSIENGKVFFKMYIKSYSHRFNA